MVDNDCTDATHPRRAVAWVCAGGLSAVPLLSVVFLIFITYQTKKKINSTKFLNGGASKYYFEAPPFKNIF
jgi:hypothetical protein